MFYISTARKLTAGHWDERAVTWNEFCGMCAVVTRTPERLADFMKAPRAMQTSIKDVGSFVGGRLLGGKRSKHTVIDRQLITLDYDHCEAAPGGDMRQHPVWLSAQELGCDVLVYSTHKHTAEAPRLRVCILLDRPLPPHLYVTAARNAAAAIGHEECLDKGSFEAERLMFLPSASIDADFFFGRQDGGPLDAALLLGDSLHAEPPEIPSFLGDPAAKGGVIGAFCRVYSISAAIERYLPDVYVKAKGRNRYTYTGGSSAGGLVVYDGDKYAWSNHDTDPARGHCRNAFDLVRIHRYGDGADSMALMTEMAMADEAVRAAVSAEQAQRLTAENGAEESGDDRWLFGIDRTGQGKIRNTRDNAVFVLDNHPGLKNRFYTDDFSGDVRVTGELPWERPAGETAWRDIDDAHLRRMLERIGITGRDRIDDAIVSVFDRVHRHPVREYLEDCERRGYGGPRLDRVFIDFLGAEDTPYIRAVTRKFFTAAVARVMQPGIKADHCPVLAGVQGLGKSTLLRIMAGEWFGDDLQTIEGKDPVEQLRGKLIEELGEMSALSRSEVNAIKAFISRQNDFYRAPYGRRAENHARQCVFCGTTNDLYFLRGDSNRRFWPVPVGVTEPRLSVWNDLPPLRDELWAEAVYYYRQGEPLFLPRELEAEARVMKDSFSTDSLDPIKSAVERFVSIPIPFRQWPAMTVDQRRMYYREFVPDEGGDWEDNASLRLRDSVACVEVICEYLGKNRTDKDYAETARRVAKALRETGWEMQTIKQNGNLAVYGKQKIFARKSGR